ncbi:Low temperature viability protein [Aaosphaeria arxii CBS 175.79]|uniref:Low temperature viability protein n=1 Tax=Aaosphaeria arxii CBS 175.79 TaxID=1450172 RepID=A0A6A5XHW6_9PLEO|nr:Low temperature viability protein [Aaosphaeria arxii CBS 175.79]KAF2012712.1 Low temperature viability protein [Aaosphaeria arxii CBS 175.79]
MPRRKFIDKKNATTFHLVHRAQNDPRIHDADAPSMVFQEVNAPNMRQASEPATSSRASQYSQFSAASGRSKIKSRGELESEFGSKVRKNEGEAANYGIYYDDSEYDYMQHMRDLGSGSGDSYFLEAPGEKKGKGKHKMDLADALREASLDDRQSEAGISVSSSVSRAASDVFGEDMAPSEFVRKMTYQDQQNIPDAIAGLQPDMDPRLREVLEALEDDAYVDDEDDIFNELAEDGYEVDQREFDLSTDRYLLDDEDDGWESDDTIKAGSQSGGVSLKAPKEKAPVEPSDLDALPAPDEAPPLADAGDNAWMDEFKKFKQDAKAGKAPKPAAPSDLQSSVLTGASALTAGGRKKKRKGALTSTSSYSMSSSALHRTDALTLLDQRFDKIEEEYAAEDFPDDMSMASGMSKMSGFSKMSGMSGMSGLSSMSEAPQLRSDFDNIMDDFLGSHSMQGKRRVKRAGHQTGLEQLEEVRKGLGPARLKNPRAQKA